MGERRISCAGLTTPAHDTTLKEQSVLAAGHPNDVRHRQIARILEAIERRSQSPTTRIEPASLEHARGPMLQRDPAERDASANRDTGSRPRRLARALAIRAKWHSAA
jgi:hypothetical protein